MGRDKARIWLALIRIVNGAAGLLFPKKLAGRVSPEPEPNPRGFGSAYMPIMWSTFSTSP